ncbi:uncharacterized protein LOC131547133 isoform X2 [Onychostoma macrolepis]|uniref:uncharacterized protein LOC131547133 isoform X2 n=1 Tax=Onychostoma macrolepis TaxID=369639 RepID=UPI002729B723|nr:uncharacterized protein LOC131547133 isoform X2 [Onychostoma macrolepis]
MIITEIYLEIKHGVFTVNITDLTEEDSGIYWCGAVQRRQQHKNKWISVIDLNISAPASERMPPKPTTSSYYTSKPAATNTASNRPITSSSSVIMFFSKTADAASPKPQPGFTSIIMLSVMGILMVFGFLVFIFFRCTQKKEAVRLRGDVHVLAENLSTKEATHTVCHYEEIICTDDHSGYSLALPVFDERDSYNTLTYSTITFQNTNYSDRTSDGPETSDSATLSP